jgi:predicted GIY-YIG superfamily endonuclease
MHYCYILYDKLSNRTYVGYTVKPSRRIRQHKGLIKGGARYTTRKGGEWEYLAIIASPEFTNRTGLSFEWHVKHKKKYSVEGRIASVLETVLNNKKFQDCTYYIYVSPLMADKISLITSLSSLFDQILNSDILCLFSNDLSVFLDETC